MYFNIFLPRPHVSVKDWTALQGIQILDGVQACKSGSTRQTVQCYFSEFQMSDSICLLFPFHLISFYFLVVPLFPFTDMTPWQKCITIKCVWWRCNCHNLNEEKANKHRLKIYSGVILSVVTDDCVKNMFTYFITSSRRALQVKCCTEDSSSCWVIFYPLLV